jgi:hypothetical protein
MVLWYQQIICSSNLIVLVASSYQWSLYTNNAFVPTSSDPVLMLVSQPIQLTLDGGLPIADAREHRIQSGRSGILGFKPGWDRRSQLRRGRQRGDLG